MKLCLHFLHLSSKYFSCRTDMIFVLMIGKDALFEVYSLTRFSACVYMLRGGWLVRLKLVDV